MQSPASPAISLKHELRTPLNHVIGYCEMLMEEAQDRHLAAFLPDLEHIHTAGRHLLAVINDLFDPNKAPAYRTSPSLFDHEIRTPLNQIIGYAEMLQEQAQDGGQAGWTGDLERIHVAARQLLQRVVEHFGSTHEEFNALASAVPGMATTFVRRVPEAPSGIAVAAADAGAGDRTGFILAVDDDAGNRDMLSRRLTRLGHTVQLAENGREALELLRRHSFDLVLLDIQMPELNGHEVLKIIKADPTLRHFPVIVLSASDETSRVAHAVELGADDYLPKPFDPVLLQARIGACLEKKRLRDREVSHCARYNWSNSVPMNCSTSFCRARWRRN